MKTRLNNLAAKESASGALRGFALVLTVSTAIAVGPLPQAHAVDPTVTFNTNTNGDANGSQGGATNSITYDLGPGNTETFSTSDSVADEVGCTGSVYPLTSTIDAYLHTCAGPPYLDTYTPQNPSTGSGSVDIEYSDRLLVTSSTLPMGTPVTIQIAGSLSYAATNVATASQSPNPNGSTTGSEESVGAQLDFTVGNFQLNSTYNASKNDQDMGPAVEQTTGLFIKDNGQFTATLSVEVGDNDPVVIRALISNASAAFPNSFATGQLGFGFVYGFSSSADVSLESGDYPGMVYADTSDVTPTESENLIPVNPIIAYNAAASAPEPSVLALLLPGVGVAGLAVRRRRQRAWARKSHT